MSEPSTTSVGGEVVTPPSESRSTPPAEAILPRRRTGMSCDNCGAYEDKPCQPWCIGEQVS